jgi:transposase
MDTSEQAILDETPKREARRRRSVEEKRRIVEETLEAGASVARVARRHARPKLACAGCDRIVQAEAPSRPIERSIAGPGLLAHVLVSKYADHLPLYRQSQIFARTGVELDRSTLAEWDPAGCWRHWWKRCDAT